MNKKGHWHHLLVDASNLITPLHYQVEAVNGEGRPIGGLLGLLDLIKSLRSEFKPKVITIIWSEGESPARKILFKGYGSKRSKNRNASEVEAIKWQKNICKEVFSFLPIRQVSVANVEAKDAVAYLCKTLQKQKLIVSTDKDYYPILSEHVQIYDPKKDLLISEHEARAILGFNPKYYLLWRTMVGNPSKGVPGIPKLGKTKATRLIQTVRATGKKFKLSQSEQSILDRNKYLFSIGHLLTAHEKQVVLEQFQNERKKKYKSLSIKKLRNIGIQESFRDLFHSYHPSKSNGRERLQ